jgi:hypothetical protein
MISTTAFSFSAPADLQAVAVRGIDSNVGRYTNATVEITPDYGWYSDPLTIYNKDKAGYQEERREVDGKPAVIVTFSDPVAGRRLAHCAGIHFPKVGDGRLKLTVFASCADTNQFPALKALFKSIRFEKGNTESTRTKK